MRFYFINFVFLAWFGCNPSPPNGWSYYRSTQDAAQYSSLSQIDTSNVQDLKPAWIFHTGDTAAKSTIECNPIIIDDVMYLTSPLNSLIAVQADSGKEMWRFIPPHPGGINRGVSYFKGKNESRIFFSAGIYVYALNALNGILIKDFGDEGKIDLRQHLGKDTANLSISLTTPGVIYKELLIIGSATGEGYEASPGHIRAYHVYSGAFEWIFHTIPQQGEEGFDTWTFKDSENYGGANDWGGLSLDEKRGVVYAATGSPTYDFYGANRAGANLYGNSVIAINAQNGKKIWHYQAVKHDIWDYDLPCAPTLGTTVINGITRDVLMQPTKMGELILLDRNTGECLLKSEEKRVPPSTVPNESAYPTQSFSQGIKLVTQGWDTNNVTTLSDTARAYIMTQARKFPFSGMYTPPSREGTITQPGTRGGMGWGGLSYDPERSIAYTSCNNFPMLFQLVKIRSADKNKNKTYEGEKLYMLNCASCHGADRIGNNDGIPGLTKVSSKYNASVLKSVIRNGKGLMPPHHQFTDSAMNQLVEYLLHAVTPHTLDDTGVMDKYVLNGFKIFTDQEGYPANKPPWGTLNAIDIKAQKIIWSVPLGHYPALKARGLAPTGTQSFGGCVATAGGLVFMGGSADEMFRAFDARTGKVLWEYQLPAGGYATPAVYTVKNKQYVVIAAGGGNRNNTKSGDAYYAFSLPEW